MTQTKDPKLVALEAELAVDMLTIKSEQRPPEELLSQTREELQTIRSLLPEHRQLNDTKDWVSFHSETEQKYKLAQERYAELKTDTKGVFDREDYADALFDALSQRKTMEMIIQHARTNPAPKQAAGCMVFAFLALPAIAGTAWWLIGI